MAGNSIKLVRAVTANYLFKKKGRGVIKAISLSTGEEHHVGLYFVNKLLKQLQNIGLPITKEDLYSIIIKESRKK